MPNALAAASTLSDLQDDPQLFQHRLLFIHGHKTFTLSKKERKKLWLHLDRGGMLFADAWCRSPTFDHSFRELVEQLYLHRPLKPISVNHESKTPE